MASSAVRENELVRAIQYRLPTLSNLVKSLAHRRVTTNMACVSQLCALPDVSSFDWVKGAAASLQAFADILTAQCTSEVLPTLTEEQLRALVTIVALGVHSPFNAVRAGTQARLTLGTNPARHAFCVHPDGRVSMAFYHHHGQKAHVVKRR